MEEAITMLQTAQDGSDSGFLTITELAGDGAESKNPVYECQTCNKRYERIDHVKRHIQSHENTRPHKCPHCPRRFNRRDLLTRHRVTHDHFGDAKQKEGKRAERAIQACQACVQAKTKCDDQRPCKRCKTRGTKCESGPNNRRSAILSDDLVNQEDLGSDSISPTAEIQIDVQPAAVSNDPIPPAQQYLPTEYDFLNPNNNVDVLVQDPNPNTMLDDVDFDIPMLDDAAWANFTFHADLSQIYQDVDFQFDGTLQSIHSDSWPTLDIPPDLPVQSSAFSGNGSRDAIRAARRQARLDSTGGTVTGFEAFKRSPWLWTPANQDHAYAEHSQLAVNEEHILNSPEMLSGVQSRLQVLPELKQVAARDEILAMVLKFSKSPLKIRSFPSLSLLNILMQAFFFRERTAIDIWIHEPTFSPDQCKRELLAGIVAAGSMYFAASNIWKMGLALQEVVKLAICDGLDEDNRLARQLQTGQTFLLWIEVGLWSGFRRKMEIGEGFAHTVPTMLRRAGAFHNSRYSSVPVPNQSDQGDELRRKWLEWVDQQSFKRLVVRVFINEIRSSIAFVRSPVFSGTELTFTLPASRDLWDAKTPEEWKQRMLSPNANARNVTMTLADGMHDISRLETEEQAIDMALSAHAILYGFWARIWAFLESKTFYRRDQYSNRQSSNILWLEAQRQQLYNGVQSTRDKLSKMKMLSPEAQLVSEFLMMSLHSCSEDLQRFAGRYGDEEMRSALPQLREWANSSDAPYATWHAGQVLRAARLYPPTQLRGFHAIAAYHACLTLWEYAMLSNRLINSRKASPAPGDAIEQQSLPSSTQKRSNRLGENDRQREPHVLLDGDETTESRTFLAMGRGLPSLQLADQKRDIRDPSLIPAVMMHIFRENFPAKSDPLPPLLENLGNLMNDLSKAKV